MREMAIVLKGSAAARLFNMFLVIACATMSLCVVGCSSDEKEDIDKSYVEGVKMASNKSEVCNGSEQMLTITFETDNGYALDTDNYSMINFFDGASSSKGGKHQARIQVRQNTSGQTRAAEIYIAVTGHNRTKLMDITQKSGASDEVVVWIDERLQEEYYWMDEYNQKHSDFDFTLAYDKFLSQTLLTLTTNQMDGGVDSRGNRYIYSYIEKLTDGRASSVSGYGLLLASTVWTLDEAGSLGFAVEHVYPGSSAEKANIRRGDIISQVMGNDLTESNINDYWYNLQYGSLGATIEVKKLDGSSLEEANISLSMGNYQENPVAFCGVVELPEAVADSGKKIGYLSYLSFDADFDTELIEALEALKSEGITDLILDLRLNGGGSVNSSILLASSILGNKYEGQIYATLKRHPNNKHGNSECKIVSKAGSTVLPALDMPALWVIATGNTASASEMVIAGLRGLDVPVTVVGAQTEGKNCGMDVMEKTIGQATYSYAPITFLNYNAKDFTDYADGFEPDIDINSYYNKSSSESIKYFARIYPMPSGPWGASNKDLALFETVLQICGTSVLDRESGESTAFTAPRLNIAESATRAGEPIRLQHKRKVFGATLSALEREQLARQE
ncbi:MAG: hypothetical protein E7127_02900 [Rikenellaceae bacterium]|nr:hypothetical protein [Rikenellaceae bacterium]